jgi:ubiquinone/menaquinone biosynthesis C-methylase UbiE
MFRRKGKWWVGNFKLKLSFSNKFLSVKIWLIQIWYMLQFQRNLNPNRAPIWKGLEKIFSDVIRPHTGMIQEECHHNVKVDEDDAIKRYEKLSAIANKAAEDFKSLTKEAHAISIAEEFKNQSTVFEAKWHKKSIRTNDEIMNIVIKSIKSSLLRNHNYIPVNTLNALDVACGTGVFTRALAKSGWCKKVTGIDFTMEMLEKANLTKTTTLEDEDENKNKNKNSIDSNVITYIQGDAANMSQLESNSFDLVTSRLAIHHFYDPIEQIQEMERVCKPGGMVVVVDIISPPPSRVTSTDIDVDVDVDNTVANIYNYLERLRDPSHIRSLTPEEMIQALEKVNLVVDKENASPSPSLSPFADVGVGVGVGDSKGKEITSIEVKYPSSQNFYIPYFENHLHLNGWLDNITLNMRNIKNKNKKSIILEAFHNEIKYNKKIFDTGFGVYAYPGTNTSTSTLEDEDEDEGDGICFKHKYIIVTAVKPISQK